MRREFPRKERVAAFKRSGGYCEFCTAKLFPGNIRYDHATADAMGGEPIAANCNVLCRSCHDAKTAKGDIPQIAKAKRREARHIGARVSSNPMPGWRKFDGTPVRNPRAR